MCCLAFLTHAFYLSPLSYLHVWGFVVCRCILPREEKWQGATESKRKRLLVGAGGSLKSGARFEVSADDARSSRIA